MDKQPPADAELPASDSSALDRLRRFGGGKLLGEMIALFLMAAPERVGAARAGYGRGDATEVERALHSLKSSAGQLGALRLQRLSERGEQLARSSKLDEMPTLLQDLDAELVRVREWLSKARAEGLT
jgi:HPt (histidine-containing phosphotransfer) domain-containing protein